MTVEQNDNENAPTKYSFTFEVVFTDKAGNQKIHLLEGMAIVAEYEKIGRLQLMDTGGLVQTINTNN